jgi:two-component system sensor histidine kinase YesM
MLLALVLPVCVVLLITANRLSALERENAHQYLGSNLRTVSSTVDQILQNLEFSHVPVFQDRHFLRGVRQLVPYDQREEYSDYRNITGIRSSIFRVAAGNNNIHSIYVYSFTAERFFSSRVNWNPAFNHFDGTGIDWLDTYRLSDLSQPWHITSAIEDGRLLLSSYREIRVYGQNAPIGLVSVNTDVTELSRLLNEIAPGETKASFMVDNNGRVVSSPNYRDSTLQEIMEHLPDGEAEGYVELRLDGTAVFVSYFTSQYSGFRYVIATPLDQIQTSAPVIIQLPVIFMMLLLLLIVLAMVLARHYFYKPVRTLFSGMEQLKSGDLSTELPENPTYEFNYINSSFNNTVLSLRNLINENYANKLIYKEAQLRNLQNQINEHFLYNTLDSIHWLAKMENANKACDMVFALADFYRLSLSFGQDVTPVRNVIKMLENYLYIQKFRMKDNLNYEINCDRSLYDEQILKNLLQPLVENAIAHGIVGMTKPGMINIDFARTGNFMRITVKDNGKGFTESKLEQVRQQLELQDPYCEHSFALKAIQSQLQIFYGVDIILQISSVAGEGSSVTVELPIGPPADDGEEERDGTAENDYS